jgi:ubiquinone/menaquinone biosynthesis C-methylase UbiE
MSAPDSSSFIRPEDLLATLGLRAGQTLVHLGCGAGFYLIPAAKIVGTAGKVIGVDVLSEMLAEAENRARRAHVNGIIQTIRANVEKPSGSTVASKSADWVLVANILHQSAAPDVLTEAARIAKDDGKIIIIEWDVVATPFGPPPAARVAKKDVIKVIDALSLRVVEEFSPSPYHYGLVVATH